MTVSAPGKLMLFGDHAVVYGYPCIVTAVSERLSVSESHTDQLPGDRRFIDAAIKKWGSGRNIKLSTTCMFSGKYGLGSSSAVTVATLKLLRPEADTKEIFNAAFDIILKIQGVGSGFDVAAAAFGGTLYYIKGKTIEQMDTRDMPLVVGYSGTKSNTVEMVQAVARKREQYPEKVERIFQGITKLTEEAKKRMTDGDWERVGRLMDFNQEYLRDLGVSSEKLESLISAAKGAGALGAKLSGAGGGDCMVAIVPTDKKKSVEDAISKAGGEVVNVSPHAPGVRIETTDNQDELFIVVDRDDNILGYKTRYECHHNPSLIHRTVGILIFNEKGQLLLQKRSQTKDMEPDLWCVSASGHVIKGQSDEEAAHRELQEELSTDVPLTFFKKFIITSTGETERAALFKGKSNGPFTPDAREVSEIKFFDPREIKLRAASRQLLLTQAATQSLKEAGVL